MVEHFEQRIPTGLFDHHAAEFSPNTLTTAAAITSTCLLKLVATAADRANATWFVHAGTSLGAAVHNGPIPWDDGAYDTDTDVVLKKYF